MALGSAVSGMIGASGTHMVSAGGTPYQLTIESGASWDAPPESRVEPFPVLTNKLF
jgi:hypothetical protein